VAYSPVAGSNNPTLALTNEYNTVEVLNTGVNPPLLPVDAEV